MFLFFIKALDSLFEKHLESLFYLSLEDQCFIFHLCMEAQTSVAEFQFYLIFHLKMEPQISLVMKISVYLALTQQINQLHARITAHWKLFVHDEFTTLGERQESFQRSLQS